MPRDSVVWKGAAEESEGEVTLLEQAREYRDDVAGAEGALPYLGAIADLRQFFDAVIPVLQEARERRTLALAQMAAILYRSADWINSEVNAVDFAENILERVQKRQAAKP